MSTVKSKFLFIGQFITYFHFARNPFFDILYGKREMKKSTLFFICGLIACPGIAVAATCSTMNLTRCLDSVCAINVSSNPAARCQYCGTSSAGTPPASSGMRSLSLGASARYTLSEDELEDAPTDPGQRYVWATAQCIKKVDGCTPDDVSDVYDELIEQSCRAAGISAQMSATIADANKNTASASSCTSTIRACMVDAKRCGPDYSACEADAAFDNFFSACSVEATGCGDYIADIRTTLTAARDTAIQNADTLIASLVAGYQTAREQKMVTAQANCTNNAGRDACIETVCERNMPNKCGEGYESERVNANLLCEFYDTACNLLD